MDEQDEMPELPDVSHETLQTPEEDVTDQAQAEAGTVADDQVMRTVGESLPVLTLPRIEREDAVAPEVGAEARVPEAAGPEGRREGELIPESSASSEAAREAEGEPELVLERKHLLAVRWMHWVNFPVLFTMIWSGILIYWNDSDNAFKHAHQVYRVGIGKFTLFRFFPDWFYNNPIYTVPYKPTTGLSYHFFFMWIFAINGILYVLYLLWSKEWKFMVPHRESLKEAIQVTLVDLHLKKGLPPQTKYNGAQRIAYTSVILMGLGSLLTGLAIYKPTQAHWLTTMMGGYEMARWLHFWLTMGFCGFFVVHVGQVILAGWNNFRSMVSGFEIRRADEPSLEAERRRF